ncbi:hypothetical protein CC86DRAFT_346430 [Ophiobolus disseminans]|uniref:Uncharacterized protein n=1 Tax=Ophiobolus disseminans TaxID=1469910 RepID=A0A6A7A669_9PLEO|nr:hypothetical protein CC86DRAFT_346430 [Ophiobolus disseminans]
MATVERISLFFNLPLELREQIYKLALCSSGEGSDLLRTCREIHAEAHKFLYQRTVTFRSQDAFNVWAAGTPSNMLDQVSNIALSVQDVDLRPLLAPEACKNQPRTPPGLMTWDLYQTELDRLKQSLRQVPKVKTITIRTPSRQNSYLYRDFVANVLNLLSVVYPNLRDLRLDGTFHHQGLAFLSSFTHLESFSFDGFSASSPSDTIDILSNLKLLKSLALFSKKALLTSTADPHTDSAEKRQSFMGDVMRTMGRLASFTVGERTPTFSPTLFFTSEVLSSLLERKALNCLSLHLSDAPDMETLELLEKILEKSPIEHLELDWLGLRPTVLKENRLLTEHLKVLWVRVVNEADAFEILWSIAECRDAGDICKLEKVVLIRPAASFEHVENLAPTRKDSGAGNPNLDLYAESPDTDNQDGANVAIANTHLRGLGIHVAWYTEDA